MPQFERDPLDAAPPGAVPPPDLDGSRDAPAELAGAAPASEPVTAPLAPAPEPRDPAPWPVHSPSFAATRPIVPPEPSPWLVTAATPAPMAIPTAAGGPSTLRTALLAGALSSILTLSAAFVVVRSILPDNAAASPSPAASLAASPGASSAATAAATVPPVVLDAAPDAASATVTATARVLPSVVTINTQAQGRRGSTQTGSGSGFIIDSGGWILTNRHVVSGASTITVALADGRTLPAQLYGASSTNDLAVLRVDAAGLPAVTLGESARLALGQSIIVLGSPLGEYPGSVSTGVVSGLARAIDITGVEHLANLIQTDAAVNPGNSGGPMVDLGGRVIGIAVATSQAEGIAFGIPIDDARSIISLALAGQPIP